MKKTVKNKEFHCTLFTSHFLFFFFLLLTSCFLLSKITIAQPAKAAVALNNFRTIAILHEGRVKPLDTYARHVLLQFSGRSQFQKERAIDWLARLLFSPETTINDKIFLVNNPAIAQALGIEAEKKRRYSFNQIEPKFDRLEELAQSAFKIDPKERDIVENELLRLYENIKLSTQLSLNFAFAIAHENFTVLDAQTRHQLQLPDDRTEFSFLEIASRASYLDQLTAPLETLNQDKWSASQREIAELSFNLFRWGMAYQDLPLRIIPSFDPQDELWYSPWDIIVKSFHEGSAQEGLFFLQEAVNSYKEGSQLRFDLAVKNFSKLIKEKAVSKYARPMGLLGLEVMFNDLQLFEQAKVFYLFAFLFFLISLILPRRILYPICIGLIALGFAAHTIALILRIIILHRPPVSSLYETFIFVSFIAVLAGLIIEKMNKQWLGNLIAGLSGVVFLTIAGKFSAEGDTMKMLVAVLNSNFWLGTHVLSITIGYAGTCVAGIIGHVYLLQCIFKKKNKKLIESTYKTLLGALGFALTMTFLGTNLGGIWADQSWGRFWGWDPKENGALLIILWIALLFHARIAKIIGPVGLAAGAALGIMVVMWAWFGVNLLSIGLHSYGWTSGIAVNLGIYVFLQIVFISIAYPLAKKN